MPDWVNITEVLQPLEEWSEQEDAYVVITREREGEWTITAEWDDGGDVFVTGTTIHEAIAALLKDVGWRKYE